MSASPAPANASASRVAQNRRIRGLWQSAIPSRFLDELPPEVVEVKDTGSAYGGYGYGGRTSSAAPASRCDAFDSSLRDPRLAARPPAAGQPQGPRPADHRRRARRPLHRRPRPRSSKYSAGERVFHLKFGYGHIDSIEGNKLTIEFEKAGRKKVLDSFVQKP